MAIESESAVQKWWALAIWDKKTQALKQVGPTHSSISSPENETHILLYSSTYPNETSAHQAGDIHHPLLDDEELVLIEVHLDQIYCYREIYPPETDDKTTIYEAFIFKGSDGMRNLQHSSYEGIGY